MRDLPTNWSVRRLSEVCTFQRGLTYKKSDEVDKSRNAVLRANNVALESGELDFNEIKYINDSISIPPTKIVKSGSLLVCTASGSKRHLGKVAFIDKDYGYAFGGFMGLLTPNTPIEPRYLYWLMRSKSYGDYIAQLSDGANINNLKFSQLGEFNIPLPPLPEQKRIVAILDETFAGIDTAVANTEKNLTNARELFESSVITRVFGDLDTKGWLHATVEKLARSEKGSIRTGPFGSQLLHSEFVDEGIAVLGIDNAVQNEFTWGKRRYITEEKYKKLERYTVKPGDVLITIMGTCGRCAVVPNDIPVAINTKHLCCISLDQEKCLPDFIHAYFLYHPISRQFLESHAKGSIMSGLNMGIIKELPVRLPGLDKQRLVVASIQELSIEANRLESIYQQKLAALAELKQSLLEKAFSGELTSGRKVAREVLEEAAVA